MGKNSFSDKAACFRDDGEIGMLHILLPYQSGLLLILSCLGFVIYIFLLNHLFFPSVSQHFFKLSAPVCAKYIIIGTRNTLNTIKNWEILGYLIFSF